MFKCFSSVLLALSLLCVNTAQAANFKDLSLQTNHLEQHHAAATVILPFLKDAKKDLKNQVSFNYYSLNMLYPENDAYSALNNGLAHFGVLRPSLFAGVMNAMTVVEIPGIMSNAIVGSKVSADILDKFPEARAELPKNTEPFAAWTAAAWELHTVKPIKSLADIKGLRIIVWDSNMQEVAKKLGANPLLVPPFDTYLALSKNQADGVIAPLDPIRSLKLAEVVKCHYILGLGLASFEMVVHKPLWTSFPKNIQDYFLAKGGQNFSSAMGYALEDGAVIEIDWLKANGHTVIYPSEKERADLDKLLASFKKDWLKKVERNGLKNAKEILAYAEERAKYHTSQLK